MMIAARATRVCECGHRAAWHMASGAQPCGEGACPCRRYVDGEVVALLADCPIDARQTSLWEPVWPVVAR